MRATTLGIYLDKQHDRMSNSRVQMCFSLEMKMKITLNDI